MIRTLLRRFRIAASIAPHVVRALTELVITQTIEHTIPRRKLGRLGQLVYIPRDVSFRYPKNIELDSHVVLGPGNRLWASNSANITVGAHALFGPGVTVITANHRFDSRDEVIAQQAQRERDVRIGEDAWIGANAVILPGVAIGNGAIVAAGAVVNHNVDPFTIVGGIPARQIGTR